MSKPPVVLVHGAFHGGWCWKHVARLLRSAGHDVYTPTQTGMATFVEDIVGVIRFEDLDTVVLVGHSYGARTICGVADQLAQAVRQLIFIDGGLPMGNISRLDAMDARSREARISASAQHDDGISVPPPSATHFGVDDPALATWLEARLTPQPLSVDRSALVLKRPIGAGRPVTYVRCVGPTFAGTEQSAAFAREQAGWRYVEVNAGHNVIVTDPELTAGLILDEIERVQE
jgi:pimeloyl-ACP methyl ester carboxylesterase